MKQKKFNGVTVKWIVLFVVAVGIGTFMTNVLENTEINVWLARGIGALITVTIALIAYPLWMKKGKK